MMYLFPTVILAVITAVILFLMWRSWNRQKKAHGLYDKEGTWPALNGEVLKHYTKVQYVSSNESGRSLARVQYPGLRYRGFADLKLFDDGIQIIVTGENPVRISKQQLDNVTQEQMRIGKVVEKNGLAVIHWHTDAHKLETSLRFSSPTQQQGFLQLMKEIISNPKELKSE